MHIYQCCEMGWKKVDGITSFILQSMKWKLREISIITKDHRANKTEVSLELGTRFLTFTATFFLLLSASIHEIKRMDNKDTWTQMPQVTGNSEGRNSDWVPKSSECQAQLSYLLAVWTSSNHLISLRFHFLISKMEIFFLKVFDVDSLILV